MFCAMQPCKGDNTYNEMFQIPVFRAVTPNGVHRVAPLLRLPPDYNLPRLRRLIRNLPRVLQGPLQTKCGAKSNRHWGSTLKCVGHTLPNDADPINLPHLYDNRSVFGHFILSSL